MVLCTMMWRMKDRFVRLPLYGYWVKDRPYEKANYTLGTETVRSEEEDKEIDGLEQLL